MAVASIYSQRELNKVVVGDAVGAFAIILLSSHFPLQGGEKNS
jgi:hypothetical protein